jgi:hypothetical protein
MTKTISTGIASRTMTGMALGVSMMTLFGSAWLAWGFSSLGTDSPWLIAAVTLGVIALLVPSFNIFQIGRKTGKNAAPLTPEEKRLQGQMGWMFGIIFGAEGLLIFLAVSALSHFHLQTYISTAIAAIVGLHFLPLARLYRFPLYYAVGGVMVVEALIFLTLPSPMREIAVELSMGATLWLTCILVLREGFLLARSGKNRY